MRVASPASPRRNRLPTAGARPAAAALLALAALGVVAGACRRGSDRAASSEPPAPNEATDERPYAMADLVSATRLDARLQRVIALTGEYKMALTFDRGPRLTEHTEQVARRLDGAVPAAEHALAEVRDPRDRTMAQPLIAGARRWPALLRDARAELLESPHPATRAADALASTDDEMARALQAYRAFRATWRIADSPAESEQVLEFLRARRDLEAAEAELGRSLPLDPGKPTGASAGARTRVDEIVARARKSATGIDQARKPIAERFVESEAQALAALTGMAAPGKIDEQRERDALTYQIAKAGALDALADYVELTAKGSAAPR